MRVYDLLNELEERGTLATLYAAGLINVKTYNQKDIYGVYCALMSTPRYVDDSHSAIRETARQCGVAKATAYRAVADMKKEV